MFNPFRSIHTGNKIDTAVSNVEPLVTQLGATTATANAALDVGNMAMAEISNMAIPKVAYVGKMQAFSVAAGGLDYIPVSTVFMDPTILEYSNPGKSEFKLLKMGVYNISLGSMQAGNSTTKTFEVRVQGGTASPFQLSHIFYTGTSPYMPGINANIYSDLIYPYVNLAVGCSIAFSANLSTYVPYLIITKLS